MTREEQLAELLKQIGVEQLKNVPTNTSDSFTAIAVLQSSVTSLQGYLSLLLAFITSTEESKKEFRKFIKLAANADIPKENREMQQAARILDLAYPEMDDPQSPDKQKGSHQSKPSLGENVILFPGFPRKDPKQ
ncbi:hypothetical protein [uncultured Lamprocystis sp.]|jgi:hypothetical protein|uniref:hypothetical protein n=1 Tax=uncultured Lamprocystis sp. TaxID=543132 RepID=UPI0025DD14B6|nr:hypothetical protein [uncultured Lamprocystis sp.]